MARWCPPSGRERSEGSVVRLRPEVGEPEREDRHQHPSPSQVAGRAPLGSGSPLGTQLVWLASLYPENESCNRDARRFKTAFLKNAVNSSEQSWFCSYVKS